MFAATETRSARVRLVRGGGGGDQADADPGDHSGQDQPGQGRPGQEQHRGDQFGADRGEQQSTSAEPVRGVPGQKQAADHADRVGGEDHRDHEGGEAVALAVRGVERGRDGGERHRAGEDQADRPEAVGVRKQWEAAGTAPGGRRGADRAGLAGRGARGHVSHAARRTAIASNDHSC